MSDSTNDESTARTTANDLGMTASARRYRDKSLKQIIQNRADTILQFPDGEFDKEDLDPAPAAQVKYFYHQDVLDVVGQREIRLTEEIVDENGESKTTEKTRYTVHKYSVNDRAREIAEDVVAQRDPIAPCGHSGVRNCGDHFECCCPVCDETFDRDELEVR